MEIVYRKNQEELLRYLPYVKLSVRDWIFVDIRLTDPNNSDLTIDQAAESVHALFKSLEGKLYVINAREILMMVRWGRDNPATAIGGDITKAMPKDGCQVFVHEPTVAGITKLEILITYNKPPSGPATLADLRAARRENVVIVADDDMYMRMLVKKAVGANYTVIEIGDGGDVLEAYKKHVPDVLLLDIHMPNKDGTGLLQQILAIDPRAYIIMLSADSSRENVEATASRGAKGFLTKPFTKEKLQGYLTKCPTIS